MTLEEIKNADELTLRNRLAELRGIKRTRKLSPDEVEEGQVRAAANKMMEFDPGAAIGWMQRADQLKSKRYEQSPEAVRFKLQSALNSANQELSAYVQRNGASPTDTGYTDRVKLVNAIKKELTTDTPSLQRAYLAAQGIGAPADSAPTDGAVPDYNSLVAEVNAAKKLGYAKKVKALESITAKMPNVQLSEAQRTALSQAINSAMKEGAPKKLDTLEDKGKQAKALKEIAGDAYSQLVALSTKARDIRSALANFSANPGQAYYMSLKKALGDAIGKTDFAGLSGFDLVDGLLAKAKEFANSSPVSEEKAKSEVIGFVNQLNSAIKDANSILVKTLDDAEVDPNLPARKSFITASSVAPVRIPSPGSSGNKAPPTAADLLSDLD